MERENLFIIIAIVLLLSVAIYESMTTNKGSIILGKQMGRWLGGNDETNEHFIDGQTLPPLVEYKKDLRMAMIKAIDAVSDIYIKRVPSSKAAVLMMKKDFGKYYTKAFSRYIFDCGIIDGITNNLVPNINPVNITDLEYFFNTYGIKDLITLFKKSTMPYWPKFNKTGQRIRAEYLDGVFINHVTGDRLHITVPQYNRLKEIYTGPPELFDALSYTALYVYNNLGAIGNYGSIPIGLIDDSFIELFGSPLNTQQKYCSAFDFETKYFGSFGNFFNYNLVKGQKYTCNPPYVFDLMAEAARRVTTQMNKMGKGSNISMMVVFPIWDAEGLREIGEIKAAEEKDRECPNDIYEIKAILDRSGLVRDKRSMHKNNHKYYCWYTDSLVTYAHTYIYVLSTEETPAINLSEIITKWDLLAAEIEKKEFSRFMPEKEEEDVKK